MRYNIRSQVHTSRTPATSVYILRFLPWFLVRISNISLWPIRAMAAISIFDAESAPRIDMSIFLIRAKDFNHLNRCKFLMVIVTELDLALTR